MKVAVVGTGYVGLVTGTCLADVGHEVICIDKDEAKVQKMRQGICPIYEPTLEDAMQVNITHERLFFSTHLPEALEKSQLVFIAVGTPELEDGSADLSHVKAVAKDIATYMTKETIVVVKSTVPVGTCDEVERLMKETLEKRAPSDGLKVYVVSNPEFLKEGSAVDDFMNPERIILGLKEKHLISQFQELYAPFITDDPSRLLVMNRRSSELCKYGANTMLAARITMMNELALLCDMVHADIDEVRKGMGSDSRIGPKFLYPGPGYGGSCFPKDVEALIKTSKDRGFDFKTLNATKEANERQKLYASEKPKNWLLKNAPKGKVMIWGLTFKQGTDDVRESPALVVVKRLLQETSCSFVGYDPRGIENFSKTIGINPRLSYVTDAYEGLQGAHALIVITDWPEFKRPHWQKVKNLMDPNKRAVFDLRNQYNYDSLKPYGFYYECMGRKDSKEEV